ILIVLVGAVIILAVVVVRSQRGSDDPREDTIEQRIGDMLQAQQALVGKVDTVAKQQVESSRALTDSFGKSQRQLSESLVDRLNKVEAQMEKSLASTSKETAKSLVGLKERLGVIDKAQDNIKALSEQVVSLQHVLDDNPARGAFGELQLADIVESMLPSFAYQMQAQLANGKQVDCLILLPDPPGPISVDAKFPLKAYQEMLAADNQADRDKAGKRLAADTKQHIRDIAEKYVAQPIDGEQSTADNALMFIPSEAVYGELHAHHPTVIAESHKRKVYLVSPTTLMATLTTVRAILRDVEMQKQASVIQREVGVLLTDVGRLSDRVVSLDKHFGQATRDIEQIKTSTRKIVSRGDKIESLDLGDEEQPPALEETANR
ncbi:MAG: DNA recombination protein RmuC, partial [Actinomycetota bacterium]|nr:DNA recombination protein RmuC [Actinomycetota bacterium]MDK1027628.1 DNA recombination protein RmuC [Actinomycetota bacterium]